MSRLLNKTLAPGAVHVKKFVFKKFRVKNMVPRKTAKICVPKNIQKYLIKVITPPSHTSPKSIQKNTIIRYM